MYFFTSAFQEIGGYGKLEEKYAEAIPDSRPPNTTCGEPRDDFFHVFRDPINSDLPWPAMLFGITINSVWYWCTDQVVKKHCFFELVCLLIYFYFVK